MVIDFILRRKRAPVVLIFVQGVTYECYFCGASELQSRNNACRAHIDSALFG